MSSVCPRQEATYMQVFSVVREVHLIQAPLFGEVLHLQGGLSLWGKEEEE